MNRDERLCPKCTGGVVEDELHFLFECPFYDEIRTKFSAPLFAQFGGPGGVASVMQHQWCKCVEFMEQEPRFVARYVHECLQKRRYEDAPGGPGVPAEVDVRIGELPPQVPDPANGQAPAVGAAAPQGSDTVYYSAISSDFVDQSDDDSDTASVSGGQQRNGVSVTSGVAHGALVGSSRAPR